jgi:hypothetical protein
MYDVVHKFGGCMNIRNKIFISVGLVLPVTLIYYLTYVSVDKLFSKWCKTNYCFEFPPYADTLAIYVAVVGLYFVVTSLNEWKTQEKYFDFNGTFGVDFGFICNQFNKLKNRSKFTTCERSWRQKSDWKHQKSIDSTIFVGNIYPLCIFLFSCFRFGRTFTTVLQQIFR